MAMFACHTTEDVCGSVDGHVCLSHTKEGVCGSVDGIVCLLHYRRCMWVLMAMFA